MHATVSIKDGPAIIPENMHTKQCARLLISGQEVWACCPEENPFNSLTLKVQSFYMQYRMCT